MDFYAQNSSEKPNDLSAGRGSKPPGAGTGHRKSVITKLSKNAPTEAGHADAVAKKRKKTTLSESSSGSDEPESKQSKGAGITETDQHPVPAGFYSSSTTNTSGCNSADEDERIADNDAPNSAKSRKRPQVSGEERQAKHTKRNTAQWNVPLTVSAPNAERMMKNMGYKPGTGLGRLGDGIKEPIEAKPNQATRGLGFSVPGLEPGRQDWNFESEEIVIEEKVEWIPPAATTPTWTLEQLLKWRVVDKESLDISSSTEFCDADVLEQVLKSKDTLDAMDSRDFGRARFRSNPYETIGKAIFQNRAALKMANLDAILGFELTSPKFSTTETSADELFYFADVCAGPGGFSEYVLWKKGWSAKGFGFTLKGDCDFKLQDFVAGTPESFEPHYGVNGDGNIFDPLNITSFISYVKSTTEEHGVHLVMADGGFSVDGQENIQEILSKQLYLSQIVVALAILRQGGNFICKLFDIFTPFSAGLIYLLRPCFDGVAIHKPNTSRPANSERYILCHGRKSLECFEPVLKYLLDTHELMWCMSKDVNNNNPKKDVMELVPLNILLNDEEFHTYIYNSNNQLGLRQIQNLQKIVAFYRDQNLIEKRQQETKIACLKYWDVPNDRRRFPGAGGRGGAPGDSPQARFYDLLKSDDGSFLRRIDTELTTTSMRSAFHSPCDWVAMVVGGDKNRSKRGFYMGLGGTKVHRYVEGRWELVDLKLELYRDTLFYGELVDEVYDIARPSSCRRVAFHIIDAMVLGGEDVRGLPFWERHRMCTKFARAINKPSVPTLAAVRVKQVMAVEGIGTELLHGLHGTPQGVKLYLPIDLRAADQDGQNKVLVGGLLLLKLSSDPWMIARSKSTQKLYYFNTQTRKASFEPLEGVYADFKFTMSKRIVWWWDSQTHFGEDDAGAGGSVERVHVASFLKFMQSIPP